MFMAMPYKLIFELTEFDVLFVELSNDMWRPGFIKRIKFITDVDGCNFRHMLIVVLIFEQIDCIVAAVRIKEG